MKRFISMLMAVAMIAAVMLAFPAPANANNYIHVTQPYYEDYFVTNEAGTYAEVSFTVPITGDYVIQTFGFYDEDGALIEDVSANAELYWGNNDIGICQNDIGYDNDNLFMHVSLNANYLYTLYIWFAESVYFGRLSFTNASGLNYQMSSGFTSYHDIHLTGLTGFPGTITGQLEFDNLSRSRAMVIGLKYNRLYDYMDPSLHVEISAHCCACTHVTLVVPYGHALDGEQVVFDACQTSIEYWLEAGVKYYIVIYFGLGDSLCTEHGTYPVVDLIIEVF